MSENFKHVQNTTCEYFPCHKGPGHKDMDPATFNCLFCYCPLYFLQDCGGSPGWRGLVKDCTGCTLPHAPGGWEAVQKRLLTAFADLRKGRAPATLGPKEDE